MFSFEQVFNSPYFNFIVSFVICTLITPLVVKLAFYKKWIVAPRNDRWHKKPTALMGGIGIFTSYSIAVFIHGPAHVNWIIYAACFVMFAVGLLDDLREVKPIVKLLAQVVCTFSFVFHGYIFGGGLLGWAGIPLTFIWVIGITNAINLLDNMDGLAAGISAIVAVISGVLGILNDQYAVASMAFALSGACLGFLIYNFKPAKIFMGDSGSLFLGFSLSLFSISVQGTLGSSSAVLMLVVPLGLMAIPIMDTTLVTVKRIFAGRRIDQGGRDHTSHRLVALGFSERKAVLFLYGISVLWGLLCIMMFKVQINNLVLCILILGIFSVIFSVILSKVKVYDDSEEHLTYLRLRGQKTGDRFSLRFFLLHKKLIIGVCTDILIVYCSFLVAAKTMRLSLGEDYAVLGLFICVKISIFYFSNLYYRLLRYIAVIELAGYLVSTFGAAVLLGIILYFKDRTADYTPYFLMVDFLLTFTVMLFSRLLYRWLTELISKSRQFQKRVIIYGAGDSGYLLVKELLQNHGHQLSPVGWIDDDSSKHNMYLYGFKVFGGEPDLVKVCNATRADIVLISTNTIDASREDHLRTILAKHDIELGRFSMSLYFR